MTNGMSPYRADALILLAHRCGSVATTARAAARFLTRRRVGKALAMSRGQDVHVSSALLTALGESGPGRDVGSYAIRKRATYERARLDERAHSILSHYREAPRDLLRACEEEYGTLLCTAHGLLTRIQAADRAVARRLARERSLRAAVEGWAMAHAPNLHHACRSNRIRAWCYGRGGTIIDTRDDYQRRHGYGASARAPGWRIEGREVIYESSGGKELRRLPLTRECEHVLRGVRQLPTAKWQAAWYPYIAWSQELTRRMIAALGWERIVAVLGGEIFARSGEMELVRVPGARAGELNGAPIVLLRVRCPSTGAYYGLRVPPESVDCETARRWTLGLTIEDRILAES